MNMLPCAPEPVRSGNTADSSGPGGRYRMAVAFQPGQGVIDERLIREAAGYDLISVGDPAVFSKILDNIVPDLILVDLACGQEQLVAVAPALETAGYSGRAPCIGISTRQTPEPPRELVRQLDGVIRLPIHREQFISALGACL